MSMISGPSLVDKGCKSRSFTLQELMTSPSLGDGTRLDPNGQIASLRSNVPLPSHQVNYTIAQVICGSRIHVLGLEVRQRMRECSSRSPGHGEHHMKRYSERLSTMHMREAGRVCNNRIGDE